MTDRGIKCAVLAVLCLLVSAGNINAKFTVFDVQGTVSLSKGGKLIPIEKNMELDLSDVIVLKENSSIQILNTLNSKIIKETKPGSISLQQIFVNSRSQNAISQIVDNVKFSRQSSSGSVVYLDNGVVTRSMAIYDEEGSNKRINPKVLGSYIEKFMNSTEKMVRDIPVEFNIKKTESGGLGFTVKNRQEYPVYLNVIKYYKDSPGKIVISEFGQPTGCFTLLPGQSVSKEQNLKIVDGEQHLLIITPYSFDLDQMINNIDVENESENDSEYNDIDLLDICIIPM